MGKIKIITTSMSSYKHKLTFGSTLQNHLIFANVNAVLITFVHATGLK